MKFISEKTSHACVSYSGKCIQIYVYQLQLTVCANGFFFGIVWVTKNTMWSLVFYILEIEFICKFFMLAPNLWINCVAINIYTCINSMWNFKIDKFIQTPSILHTYAIWSNQMFTLNTTKKIIRVFDKEKGKSQWFG